VFFFSYVYDKAVVIVVDFAVVLDDFGEWYFGFTFEDLIQLLFVLDYHYFAARVV
jgi:hypothetical protein